MGSGPGSPGFEADEVAVARFLARTLDFTGIPRLLEAAVGRFGGGPGDPGIDELVALDREIRSLFSTGPIGGLA